MRIQIFNVEHGACALVTGSNGARLMIDCGHSDDSGWKPGTYLASIGVSSLEMLAITNYDEDHVSGLSNLLSRVQVQWWLRNPTVSALTLKTLKSETGIGPGIDLLSTAIATLGPGQGAEPEFGDVRWEAFWNQYPHFDDENNLSMAVYLFAAGVGFLFPGDLEGAGWKNILSTNARFREVVRQTHVLVASHHGRESGICSELFDVYSCRPTIVVISDDYHQFDTQKTTSYYQSKCSGFNGFRGIGRRWVLTTRSDGNITFETQAQGILVS